MSEFFRKKYFSTEVKKGESLFIERPNGDSIELRFGGMNSANHGQLSFELPADVFIRKQEKLPTRKVRTL